MGQKKNFTFSSKDIPTSSGCYLFWDKDDTLLYVGKAKNLRKRVGSYFQKKPDNERISVMVKKIDRIETRIVRSEMEALILERNLIKEHMPRYNVRLRDDKNFMYLRITKEERPKLELVRQMSRDGSTYIGPKTSSKGLKDTVRFCQKFFGVRMVKPGQDYYLNLVNDAEVSLEEYQASIDRMKKFLRGHTKEIVADLQARMLTFATEKNFEAAGATRDLIQSIDRSTEKQLVSFPDGGNRDIIHFAREERQTYFVRLTFRDGVFRDQNEIAVESQAFEDDETVLENFLCQFYEKVTDLPSEILLPLALPNPETLSEYFAQLSNIEDPTSPLRSFPASRLTFSSPQKGDKAKILHIARLNAEKFRDSEKIAEMSTEENFAKALPELAKALDLADPPRRIECYDISHFSGQGTVGSMVVFLDGKPAPSQYRRFHIKDLPEGKIDDFASMKEVLSRRFGRLETGDKKEETRDKRLGDKRSKTLTPDSRLLTPPLVLRPATSSDLKTYHDIREKEIFHRYHEPDFVYNRDHPDEKKKDNHPMVFTLEDEIIGVVRLDHKGKKRIIMRLFAIVEELQGKGYGTQALQLIEDYTLEQGRSEIVFNANKTAIPFYEKNDFVLDFWKGDSPSDRNRPMGKKITPKKEKWEAPDLIVIDGGKGQLSAVMGVMSGEAGKLGSGEDASPLRSFAPSQLIALAKREEQIFRPGKKEPLELSFDNPALKLLQRLRDEAHRFAITFNRSVRKKAATRSALDEVPGIGPTTKKKLLQTFETVPTIRKASDEDLLKVINAKQLEQLRRYL